MNLKLGSHRILVIAALTSVLGVHATLASPLGKNADLYFIGNSLTRGLSQDRLDWLFSEQGGTLRFGTQGAANSPLYWHLERKNDNGDPLNTENLNNDPSLGADYPTVLSTQQVDAVVIQPFQYWLETDPTDNAAISYKIGDRQATNAFIDYARGNNPQSNVATERFYIYGTWPQTLGIHYRNPSTPGSITSFPGWGDSYVEPGFTFKDFYESPYLAKNEGTHIFPDQPRQSVPSRDFYERLVNGVNEDNPTLTTPVSFIPVGDVMAVLDEKIRNDELPGIEAYFTRPDNAAYYAAARTGVTAFPLAPTDAFVREMGVINFYADRIHMNDQPHAGIEDGTIGAYVAAITMYAVITGESPVGTVATDGVNGWQRFDPIADAALITALQQTVWQVVTNDPLTGVVPEPGTLAMLGLGAAMATRRRRATQP